ncbi:Hypothetical predicted protein [Podarcis lilfordi]|uniref:Uncharacterized protein n=1 Tax=Podarcis lilfordi TaxID=74358 RepID=A0AA35LC72_9SAUR|nr:Hypothetical predicted protein [Podarcis lilfordi]
MVFPGQRRLPVRPQKCPASPASVPPEGGRRHRAELRACGAEGLKREGEGDPPSAGRRSSTLEASSCTRPHFFAFWKVCCRNESLGAYITKENWAFEPLVAESCAACILSTL